MRIQDFHRFVRSLIEYFSVKPGFVFKRTIVVSCYGDCIMGNLIRWPSKRNKELKKDTYCCDTMVTK